MSWSCGAGVKASKTFSFTDSLSEVTEHLKKKAQFATQNNTLTAMC
jgi:hypothetical protein